MIDVYLYGKFRDKVPGSTVTGECLLQLPVQPGDTIMQVMEQLNITPDDVAHIFLNYQYSVPTRKIKPGDRLAIFPIEMSVLYRQYFVKHEE